MGATGFAGGAVGVGASGAAGSVVGGSVVGTSVVGGTVVGTSVVGGTVVGAVVSGTLGLVVVTPGSHSIGPQSGAVVVVEPSPLAPANVAIPNPAPAIRATTARRRARRGSLFEVLGITSDMIFFSLTLVGRAHPLSLTTK
jgi:hypothetical protein